MAQRGRKKQNSSISLPSGRKRTISPGFFTDAALLGLSPLHRIFFEGLFIYADREGRLLYRPIDLKVRLLPMDPFDPAQGLADLAGAGLIRIYEAAGLKVIALKPRPWREVQRLHPDEPDSALPPHPDDLPDVSDHGNDDAGPIPDHGNWAADPILGSGPSGSAGPAGSSGSAGPAGRPPKKLSWHFELLEELHKGRRARMEELGLPEEPDEQLDPPYIATNLKRLRDACGGDEMGIAQLYDAYLAETWPAEKSPPYPLRVFLADGTQRQLRERLEAA